jgi:hypothetical protein
MNLDEAQRRKVAEWVAQGLKLSEIQSKLGSELGVRLTYMEVRLLVDDLRLTPKDPERPKTPESPLTAAPPAANAPGRTTPHPPPPAPPAPPAPQQGVSVSVDELARPGAIVSGKVTFSDGNTAGWYLDQTGRLGLAPQQPGYRPPANDIQEFQTALEAELAKLGF